MAKVFYRIQRQCVRLLHHSRRLSISYWGWQSHIHTRAFRVPYTTSYYTNFSGPNSTVLLQRYTVGDDLRVSHSRISNACLECAETVVMHPE